MSSSTRERVLSKMKLMKIRIRNTIGDQRSSDLCIQSIERDFKSRSECFPVIFTSGFV
jgi:hypothetical protein